MKSLIKRVPFLHDLAKSTRDVFISAWGPYRLKKQLEGSDAIKIVVGAAGYDGPGWIPTDIQYLDLLDRRHWERFFEPSTIDAILAEHVWEHLSLDDGKQAAQTCYDYLKPGGHLRIAVPDGCNPDTSYIDYVKVGGTGPGADDHKVLYTHDSLQALLQSCGFETTLLEYWDDAGVFHATSWDVSDGMIHRSKQFDARNRDGQIRYTSLIVDAYKT